MFTVFYKGNRFTEFITANASQDLLDHKNIKSTITSMQDTISRPTTQDAILSWLLGLKSKRKTLLNYCAVRILTRDDSVLDDRKKWEQWQQNLQIRSASGELNLQNAKVPGTSKTPGTFVLIVYGSIDLSGKPDNQAGIL